jgi:hypothetical protein
MAQYFGMPWPRLGARSKIARQVESIAHTVCMKRDRRVMHFPSGGNSNHGKPAKLRDGTYTSQADVGPDQI